MRLPYRFFKTIAVYAYACRLLPRRLTPRWAIKYIAAAGHYAYSSLLAAYHVIAALPLPYAIDCRRYFPPCFAGSRLHRFCYDYRRFSFTLMVFLLCA